MRPTLRVRGALRTIVVFLAATVLSCQNNAGRQAESVELILFCGAGIRPAAEALIEAFGKTHPNVRLSTNYGGSGHLLGQITARQKGDLFMPGAQLYVDRAAEEELVVSETMRTVAYFIPVIMVAKGNPKGIGSVADLARDGLKIGFGDERSCAVGRKTLKILAKNDIDAEQIAANVVYKSGTVNELGVAIELGNVDAVILWDANARHFAASGDTVPIPLRNNDVSTIPIVRLVSSEHPREAQQFIDFATSEQGKTILVGKHYTVYLPTEAKGAQE